MLETLLLRPSLHFTIFHPTTLHCTCQHFTSSHWNFTQLHFTTVSFGLTPFTFPTAPFHLTSLHFNALLDDFCHPSTPFNFPCNLHTENPQILGITVCNLVPRLTRLPGFENLWSKNSPLRQIFNAFYSTAQDARRNACRSLLKVYAASVRF